MSLTHEILDQLYKSTWDDFDYPDYGGLPKKTSRRLMPEDVDTLQYHWEERTEFSRTEWKRRVIQSLKAVGGKFRQIKRKKL
jgi:hypothetical protein